MNITRNTHYNPCFWTALWNREYYTHFIQNNSQSLKARRQGIYSLNIRADKILNTVIQNIFYEKNTGIVQVKPEEVNDLHPKIFADEIVDADETGWDSLLIGFESQFTILEEELVIMK